MPSRTSEIIEAVRAGERRIDVARRLGMSPSYVGKVCSLVLGKATPKPTKVDYAQVRLLYDAGHSDAEIARQVGCWPHTVRMWRLVEGLPANFIPRAPGERGELQRDAVALVKGGMSFGQAAERLGMTRSAVAGACHRAGLKTGRKVGGGNREHALRAWETRRNKAAAAAIAAWASENATDLPHSDGG